MVENKGKIFIKKEGQWVVATVQDLIHFIEEIENENEKLKRKIFGLETTIEHFKEKEEKKYRQLNGGNHYEKQKDYHKR